jgi:hypothetical protein
VTASSSPSSIVITGSKQGITNPPGNPAYNASKSAVKTLAEHLSYDLSKSSPETSVHLLVPGWTFTGLSGNSPFAEGEEKKEKPKGAWGPEQVVEYLEQKMGEGKFYVICPDNDVNEETDKKRMLWAANDLVQGRPPLTRWRQEYKAEAEEVSPARKPKPFASCEIQAKNRPQATSVNLFRQLHDWAANANTSSHSGWQGKRSNLLQHIVKVIKEHECKSTILIQY